MSGKRRRRRQPTGPAQRINQYKPRSQVFHADYDDQGVYFYQAYRREIADYALEHQTFGGPAWKPLRMTWIKPSFAWVLYRSGYGRKHGQERVLRIQLSHETVASLLGQCTCKHGGGGAKGRIQWDPERDLFATDTKGREPRKMRSTKAIQIGLSKELSQEYVKNILSIQDVTHLCRQVHQAHKVLAKDPKSNVMQDLSDALPVEREYWPHMTPQELARIGIARTTGGENSTHHEEANSETSSTTEQVEQDEAVGEDDVDPTTTN